MKIDVTKIEGYENMTAEEINAAVRKAMTYDEYKWQKSQGIEIKEDFRAEGLHKVLYQCPHCKTEHKMHSEGTELWCEECGKRWYMDEYGVLSAKEGETEFSHIPDWFNWERTQVEAQIDAGTYRFEDEVEVFSLPRCWKFEKLGKAKLRHTIEEGWVLEGHYRGEDYRIHRQPLQINGLHVEYDYYRIRRADCLDISTENDSFYCYPTKENVITKIAFATEIIYQNCEKNTVKKRREAARAAE